MTEALAPLKYSFLIAGATLFCYKNLNPAPEGKVVWLAEKIAEDDGTNIFSFGRLADLKTAAAACRGLNFPMTIFLDNS